MEGYLRTGYQGKESQGTGNEHVSAVLVDNH